MINDTSQDTVATCFGCIVDVRLLCYKFTAHYVVHLPIDATSNWLNVNRVRRRFVATSFSLIDARYVQSVIQQGFFSGWPL